MNDDIAAHAQDKPIEEIACEAGGVVRRIDGRGLGHGISVERQVRRTVTNTDPSRAVVEASLCRRGKPHSSGDEG